MGEYDAYLEHLTHDAICEVLSETASAVLTEKFGLTVLADFTDDGRVEIWGYRPRGGGYTFDPFRIDPSELDRRVLVRIRNAANRELRRRVAREEFARVRRMVREVVQGTVTRVDGEEVFLMLGGGHLREWTGRLSLREQPPPERGGYGLGQVLWVLVKDVSLRDLESALQTEVVLSRSSPKLAELLLVRLVAQRVGEDLEKYRIRCCRRIAGAYSVVASDRPLPSAALKELQQELGERIAYIPSHPGMTVREILDRYREREQKRRLQGRRL